jgi:mannose-1-phosphate guanylyltransferase
MIMSKDIFAVVMAGGKGERFWPQSRLSRPKQLLSLIGNLTLIEQTVERLKPLVPAENIIIITNEEYVAPMQTLLASLPNENIIGEPLGKDTAPCVALAAALIRAKAGAAADPVMILLPADHVIRNTPAICAELKDCAEMARTGKIITIGVNPSFPSTGYGYIHCGEKFPSALKTAFYLSRGFKEKPAVDVAEHFLRDGHYKWNSGMFIWTVSVIYNAFRQYAPALAEFTDRLQKAAEQQRLAEAMKKLYPEVDRISMDYAIMEKAEQVLVAECAFDWDDVGSWTALRNQIRPESNNNIIRGLHVGLDSKDCIIVGDAKHLITTVDVSNLIIVHTDDATLVCGAQSAQRIKELVRQLASRPELAKYV